MIKNSNLKNKSNIYVLVSKKDKIEAIKILKECGLNMTDFISIALKQVIRVKGIPFEVTIRELYNNEYYNE